MYKTKSKNIIALAKAAGRQSSADEVPGDYDQSDHRCPGVGQKDGERRPSRWASDEQRIAVDTHVFRVTNRIGLVKEKDVLKTELTLMKVLPEDRWTEAHHSFIFHGRNCCSARNPKCEMLRDSGPLRRREE